MLDLFTKLFIGEIVSLNVMTRICKTIKCDAGDVIVLNFNNPKKRFIPKVVLRAIIRPDFLNEETRMYGRP